MELFTKWTCLVFLVLTVVLVSVTCEHSFLVNGKILQAPKRPSTDMEEYEYNYKDDEVVTIDIVGEKPAECWLGGLVVGRLIWHPNDNYTEIEASTNERLRLACGLKPHSQTPGVLWYKDGKLVDGASKRISQQRQWLRIKGFRARDAGTYSCQYEGDGSKEMVVIIKHKEQDQDLAGYQADIDIDRPLPEILSQHQAASLVENNTIEEPEKRVPKNIKLKEYDSKGEDPEDKIKKEHPNYGHVDNTKTKFAPRFKHPTKMFSMDMKPAGSSIRLRCGAEGNPTPNITWYKNKVTPIERSYFPPSYGKWSMAFDELTKADNGNYTCIVCNELACINHTVVLHVQERYPSKPYIKEGYPGNITVLVNDTVQLSCPLVSDLEPYLYWIRPSNYSLKDAEVGPSDMPIPAGDVIESGNPSDRPEQLTLYNVTKEQEGWYVCVAINTLGNTIAKGYLSVVESNIDPTSNKQNGGQFNNIRITQDMNTSNFDQDEQHINITSVVVAIVSVNSVTVICVLIIVCIAVRPWYKNKPANTIDTGDEHVYEEPDSQICGMQHGTAVRRWYKNKPANTIDTGDEHVYEEPDSLICEEQHNPEYDTAYEHRVFRLGKPSPQIY